MIFMNKPKKPSSYDELHDRYEAFLSTKSGTRYERLAALVFKALHEQHAVVHDLKLSGEGDGVKHQIDVTIEQGDATRRILLECKDFDISGTKVGLGIARDFWAVIDDTGANEGWIVTCNGFTADAAAYAKSKGIKLIELRAFKPEDMEGRVSQIHVNMHAVIPTKPSVSVLMQPDAQREYARQFALISNEPGVHLHDPVFVVEPEGREHINTVISRAMASAIDLNDPGCVDGAKRTFRHGASGRTIQIADGDPIPFDGIEGSFEIAVETHSFDVTPKRIAELLLKGFGSEDLIIFDDQLQRFTIDPTTGEAVLRASVPDV